MAKITSDMTIEEMFTLLMMVFAHQAQATLKFAKKIPGFHMFPLDEQTSMIQDCMFPIGCFVLSLKYDVGRSSYSWFGLSDSERRVVLNMFEPIRPMEQAFHLMGRIVHRLQPDPLEVAFLCCLHLIDSGSQHAYKELLLDALGCYIEGKCGAANSLRRGQILMCLRDMAATNKIHRQTIGSVFARPEIASLPVPQLFKDIILDSLGEPPQEKPG